MSDFTSSRKVTARKPHQCAHCRREISVGTLHHYSAGVYDGGFYTAREHFECRSAWHTLNFDIRDYSPYDGAPFLADDDFESEDKEWMRETFPIVASRLGWMPA